MKRGTKIGWLLVALSVILSVWVIASQSTDASSTTPEGLVLSDDGLVLEDYAGSGGSVTIPDTVTTINAGVFTGEAGITEVIMPDSVTSMGSSVFSGCSGLQSVRLSSQLSNIPDDAFRECQSLSAIQIPASVTAVGSNAFYGCTSLDTVSIPASVTSISTDAFSECYNLTNIAVAAGNGAYASSDGCLYNASKTRLLLVPAGKTSLAIAAGTTTIGGGALSNCDGIANVSLPNSVTTIEAGAFSGSLVDTVTIPATVTNIGAQSGWTPSTIYGISGSAAERFARDNNIVFIVQGEGSNNQDPGGSGSNQGGNASGGSNEGGSGEGGSNGEGTIVNPDGTITHPDGTITTADGKVIQSGTSAATGTHSKDATPTTADGIDPRYFLCLAIFAGGVGVILYSRFNKMKYLTKRNKER